MVDSLIARIDNRIAELKTNRTAVSKAAKLGDTFLRDLARKGAVPGIENLRKIADALKLSVEDLLGDETNSETISHESELNSLPVVGTIEAGQFRDITLLDQDEEFPVINIAKVARFSHARQYALKVKGDSMDELFPDGSYVTLVDFWGSGIEMQDGLIVHVERRISGGQFVETTLKQVAQNGGKISLLPRSSNEKHKPIELTGDEATEVLICGLVTGMWMPMSY